jgi:hypothetical protein
MALSGRAQLQRPAPAGDGALRRAAALAAPRARRAQRPARPRPAAAAGPSQHHHQQQQQQQQLDGASASAVPAPPLPRLRVLPPPGTSVDDAGGPLGQLSPTASTYSYSTYSSYEEAPLDLESPAEAGLEAEAARLEALLARLRGCASLDAKVRAARRRGGTLPAAAGSWQLVGLRRWRDPRKAVHLLTIPHRAPIPTPAPQLALLDAHPALARLRGWAGLAPLWAALAALPPEQQYAIKVLPAIGQGHLLMVPPAGARGPSPGEGAGICQRMQLRLEPAGSAQRRARLCAPLTAAISPARRPLPRRDRRGLGAAAAEARGRAAARGGFL